LYEKERQLKSKQAQLDITRQQSEQHQAELQRLNAKVQSLNAELKQRLDRSMAPVLVVSKPVNGAKIESPNTLLHFIAVDDKGIRKIDVSLNGNPVKIDHTRGLKIVSDHDRIYYLANQDATKSRIESLLGTTIKRKASKDDTVIIFYAGHGAVEPDPSNLDGDGIITVSELFSYISRKVPAASAQDQHPVKKGETEGELVIGRTK
jgi:hypothetical protein